MKGNTISLKPLNESGEKWIEKTLQLLQVQEYGKGTVRNYSQELTLLFKHYNELSVEELRLLNKIYLPFHSPTVYEVMRDI